MPELLLHYKDIITEGITRSHRGLKNRNQNTWILMLYREKTTPSYKLQSIDRRGTFICPKSEIFTTSSWYHDIFFIRMPEHISISTLPDVPKNTSDNRAANSTVILLKRVYCPQLINTHDILKGWKIEADEGPKAFAARTINEEMEAVLIQGAKRTNFITLHMAMEKPSFCSQSAFM